MQNIIISKSKNSITTSDFEFVERKGVGHPDTIADALAERLSVEYSRFTLSKFGAVLHHNFDKVGLLGGSSYVTFGKGYLVNPIRVLLNGRVSTSFAGEQITIRKLLTKWTKNFLKEKLPMIDVDNDLDIHYNLSSQSSPGKLYEKVSVKNTRHFFFEPRGVNDLDELSNPRANDTSLGVGYAPYSNLESLVLKIEDYLNSNSFHKENYWIGSDIKIMAFRKKNNCHMTICIPQIANYVKNLQEYKSNIYKARGVIKLIAKNHNHGITEFKLDINTRDDYKTCDLYLTATGSSIESGDEGLVGRGNRISGLISLLRPTSMEGICGKNPVYHIGKLYNVAAQEISKNIYKKYKIANCVYLVSQTGHNLLEPWIVNLVVPVSFDDEKKLIKFVANELNSMPILTKNLLKGKYQLY